MVVLSGTLSLSAFLVFFKHNHTLDLEILQDIVHQLGVTFISHGLGSV
jgi:hypothetical protein